MSASNYFLRFNISETDAAADFRCFLLKFDYWALPTNRHGANRSHADPSERPLNNDDQFILRYTSELKDASKFLANCILSIFERLGRSVHAVLKNFNDPTKADETPNPFTLRRDHSQNLRGFSGSEDTP
ncbi:hypothetical protein AAMO2058_001352200 [Amorphochlora amoebiformis]